MTIANIADSMKNLRFQYSETKEKVRLRTLKDDVQAEAEDEEPIAVFQLAAVRVDNILHIRRNLNSFVNRESAENLNNLLRRCAITNQRFRP